MRHHGKTCFAHLMDQTGGIQLYARADGLGDEYARFVELDAGDSSGSPARCSGRERAS
jgi:lysyl-tRNA synthetase class 2